MSDPSIPRAVVALAILAVSNFSQTVHVVAGDGSGDFTQLQAAVDAALDGDVILVRPHAERYDATTIHGRSLTIVGDGDERAGVWDVRVRELAPDDVVTLRGLDIEGRVVTDFMFTYQFVGLRLGDNAGCVWLEDVAIAGANGVPKLGGSETAEPGLVVTSCAGVVVIAGDVRGGLGASSVGGSSFPGGDGALVTASRVAFHGGAVEGGKAGPTYGGIPLPGGVGLGAVDSTAFASGATLRGGDTGDDFGSFPATEPTAPGLALKSSEAFHVDSTIAAGANDAMIGPATVVVGAAPSTVTDLDDDHRALHVPAPLRELEPADVVYAGAPGDTVLVVTGLAPQWTPAEGAKGVRHVASLQGAFVLGTARADGTIAATFRAPRLPPGVDALVAYAQPVASEARGLRFGAPSAVIVVAQD